MIEFDETVDILVIGSGSAGLAAALVASSAGKSVLVLEKSDYLGGTSAMSGAGTWIPANHHMLAAGIEDSPENALTYLRNTAPAGWEREEDALWRAFAEKAPEMLRFIEAKTPLEFQIINEPDIFAETEGGVEYGRMLSTKPLRMSVAGPLARHIRPSTTPQILSYHEAQSLNFFRRPIRSMIRFAGRYVRRTLLAERAQGHALVAGLLRGCLDNACEFRLSSRALKPLLDKTGRVCGVTVGHPTAGERKIGARLGVVLATGGFEWDEELRERHFPGPIDRIGSPRTNAGDGQRIAAEAGAALARMDQANVFPTIPRIYEGHLHGMPMTIHYDPHAIVVNRDGLRFASEFDFNFFEALDARDPQTGQPRHLPAWLIADARSFVRLPFFRIHALRHKGWIQKAASIRELATITGLPADTLESTVTRFNEFAAAGVDLDFRRGEGLWQRHKSRARYGKPGNPALGGLARPPFYAIRFNRSLLGTKGGARTDEKGRVLRQDGSVLPGLFAAGLAMANPIGTRAVGPGTTIGPCLTWGYICGISLLNEASGDEGAT